MAAAEPVDRWVLVEQRWAEQSARGKQIARDALNTRKRLAAEAGIRPRVRR